MPYASVRCMDANKLLLSFRYWLWKKFCGGVVFTAVVTDIDLETKQYIIEWEYDDKDKGDNYTGK